MAEIKQFRPKRSGNTPPPPWLGRAVTIAFIVFLAIVLEAAGNGRISGLVTLVLLVAGTAAFMWFVRRMASQRVPPPRDTLH